MDKVKSINSSTDWLILMPKQQAIGVLIGFAKDVLKGCGDVSRDAPLKIATVVYLEL